jgi:hypothetical protein
VEGVSPRDVPENPLGARGLPRHAALVALSRDHHGVLVQAQALKRAARTHTLPQAARDAARAYLDFHDSEIVDHMADEERVLLPLSGAVDPPGAERILAEHREIEALSTALRQTLDGAEVPRAVLQTLGELLDDHVRFEERAFFMHVQDRLDADALARLGEALERRRAERGAPGCSLAPRR